MCQAKRDGGNRCGYHLKQGVTTAIESYATSVTSLPRKTVEQISAGLRQEGASVEAPSREQVDGFLAESQFRARYESSLSEKKRTSIVNRLSAAMGRVTPDGATFHAWKHTVSEAWASLKRRRSAVVAVGAAAVMTVSLSACGQEATHAGVCVDEKTQVRVDDDRCDDDDHHGFGWYYYPIGRSAPAVGKPITSGGAWTVPKGSVAAKGGMSAKGGAVKAGGFGGGHGGGFSGGARGSVGG